MGALMRADWDKLLEHATERFLHTAGQAIVNQAAELCPVDTGLLRNSIHYRLVGYDSPFGNFVGAKPDESARVSAPADRQTLHVGTAVEYATDVEYGKPNNPRYPRQPYLAPAIAVMKPKLEPILASIVKEEMDGVT